MIYCFRDKNGAPAGNRVFSVLTKKIHNWGFAMTKKNLLSSPVRHTLLPESKTFRNESKVHITLTRKENSANFYTENLSSPTSRIRTRTSEPQKTRCEPPPKSLSRPRNRLVSTIHQRRKAETYLEYTSTLSWQFDNDDGRRQRQVDAKNLSRMREYARKQRKKELRVLFYLTVHALNKRNRGHRYDIFCCI